VSLNSQCTGRSKHRRTGTVPGLWVLCTLGLSAALAPYAAAATYIAPPPPESQALEGPPAPGDHYRVFLSKRPAEEITAFYAARFGAMTNLTHSSNELQSPVILSYQQVVNILLADHGDVTLADDLRVIVRWKPPANGQRECAGEFLGDLYPIAQEQHRQAEFHDLCERYGYLQNAYFQRVPDPQHPGHWIDADKWLLAAAHQRQNRQPAQALGAASAETAQRLTQLALSGHTAEANALAAQFRQQATQTTGTVTDWNAWLDVLKRADVAAYRTWVLIPTHPSGWTRR